MTEVDPSRARVVPLAILASILMLGALVIAAGYARARSHVEIVFAVRSDAPARLQVFHDASGRFSEAKSDWISLDGNGWQGVSIPVAGADATRVRLDPPTSGVLTVCGLGVDGLHGSDQIAVIDKFQLASEKAVGNCLRMQAQAGSEDPQLVILLAGASAEKSSTAGRWQEASIFLALLSVLTLMWTMYSIARMKTSARWLETAGLWIAHFDRRSHWWLASLMLVFGTMYLVITPPGAVADESAHLSKIARINGGVPFGDSGAIMMPNVIDIYGPFWDYVHNKERFTAAQVLQQVGRPLRCEPTNSALPRGASGYFPHQYLLPAIVFKATCATGASFGTFLYLSRLLNLILGTALVACGLRHAVRGKWAIFVVALLPMTLFQISSISADSLTLSLSLGWLGLLSGISGGRLDPRRAAPWLFGFALAIGLLKPGCAWVLVALLFCKPAYDEAGVSFRAAVAKFMALPWSIHVVWTLFAAGGAHALSGVDAEANRHALLHDPFEYVRLLINTFSGGNAMRLARSMIGVLGWLDVFLPAWAYWLAASALLATLWTNETAVQPARGTRPLALLFAIGSLGVLSLPLYLYWTLPGAANIQGLQGRYFTISVAFVLVWCSFRAPSWIRTLLVAAVLIATPMLNLVAIHQLYDSYFVIGRPG